MTDAINPSHYKRLPAEAIEIIQSAIENAPSNQDAYLHGQVLKYVLRCWSKKGIEDLKKAKWYLDRLIDSLDEWEKQEAADLKSLKDHPFGKPKTAPLNSDAIPEGYRKLNDSSEEPRQIGDLRWSVAERRYVEISGDEIGYANRDNWAACRKITWEVTGEVTGEVNPPDGWRWIENGELLRRGDRRYKDFVFWDLEARYVGANASDAFDTKFIRRNRFDVGESVVYTIDGTTWTYKKEIDDGPRFPKSAWITTRGGVSQRTCVNHLAPYIEDAK